MQILLAAPAAAFLGLVLLASADAPGASDDERFVTDRSSPVVLPLPDEENAFTFAVFGDRTGGPREGVSVLEQAVVDVNLIGPDLVMTVGDLVQGYNDTAAWLEESREYHGIMERLDMPWFPVAGNHDVYWRGPERPEDEHESNYEQHFGPLWYAFEHKDAWFVVLYSDEGDPRTGRKSFGDPECQRMSPEQFAWLDRTLERAHGAQHVFVFLHHPRWLEGGYGDDWRRVHTRLARAGNVRAVFAGHIHRMRYDGVRDGIEYFALATVGGHLERDIPRGGFLHEYHLVTVRDEGIDVAAFGVGAALDVRALTGAIMEDVRLVDMRLPGRLQQRPIASGNAVSGTLAYELSNPSEHTLELSTELVADDQWLLSSDHVHTRIAPGERETIAFSLQRDGRAELRSLPRLTVQATLTTPDASFPLPVRTFEVPVDPGELPEPAAPRDERVLDLDGRDDVVRVASSAIDLPDGPFTLECWMKADAFRRRQGLVAKTQNCEYGFFVSSGRPSFSVHLDGAYVDAAPDDVQLEVGRWYHLAGVFDGTSVRLFVDGRPVAAVEGSGSRTRTNLPLVVGADVDGSGGGTSHFVGRIDEVRLSRGARYSEASFVPLRRFAPDPATALLLHFDGSSPWAFDSSSARAHALLENGAHRATDDRGR